MPEKIEISAIICEFDPLHLGHRLLLDKARAAGGAVCCIMSGHFLQRGAPAMLDKWARTRCALLNGADLVIELPLPFACAGAERFAAGGVALAGALGAGRLFFGSEDPDTARLTRLAEALLSEDFPPVLAACNKPGLSFAQRRQQAVATLLGPEEAALLSLPNAILGIEYIKAILLQNLPIRPAAIQRAGAGHGESALAQPGAFLSATQLRDMAVKGDSLSGLVPAETLEILKEERLAGRFPAQLHRLERAVLCRLRTMPPTAFAALPDLSEGLENRLYKASRQACSLDSLYSLVKSKRYSHARVRRLVLAAFLGLKAPIPTTPPYIRPLGMTRLGSQVLKAAQLPVAARPDTFQKLGGLPLTLFQTEARAGDLYALACPEIQPPGRDYWEKLIRLP